LSKLMFPVSDPQPHPVTILTLVGAGDTIDFAHRASLTCALAHSLPLTSPISPSSARARLLATAHTHPSIHPLLIHLFKHTHTHYRFTFWFQQSLQSPWQMIDQSGPRHRPCIPD